MLFQTTPPLDEIVDVATVSGWDVVTAIGIVLASILIAMFVRRILKRYLTRIDHLSDPISSMMVRGAGYAVVLGGVLLSLPFLGFKIEPTMLLLLIGAVLLFFAARPLMEDFSAGIVLQSRSPFVIGDLIEHEDHRGTVVDVDGRATVLMTDEGVTVRIQNTKVLASPIVNLSVGQHRRSTVTVGVAYGTDLDRAAQVLTDAVTGLEHVLENPNPRALAARYADSSIDFDVWIWHGPSMIDEAEARDDAVRAINRALKDAGIVIAFPQRDIWLRTEPPDQEEKPDPP